MPIVIAHDVPGAAAMVASNIGQYATARQQQEDALRNAQIQQQWNQQARGNAIQEMQLGREWQQQDIANQFRNEQLRMAEERAAEQGAQGWAKLAQDEQLRLQQQQSLDAWRNMQDKTKVRGQDLTYSLGQDKIDVQEANLKQQKEWHTQQLEEKKAEFQKSDAFRRAQLGEEMRWHVEQIYLANAKLTQATAEKDKDRENKIKIAMMRADQALAGRVPNSLRPILEEQKFKLNGLRRDRTNLAMQRRVDDDIRMRPEERAAAKAWNDALNEKMADIDRQIAVETEVLHTYTMQAVSAMQSAVQTAQQMGGPQMNAGMGGQAAPAPAPTPAHVQTSVDDPLGILGGR